MKRQRGIGRGVTETAYKLDLRGRFLHKVGMQIYVGKNGQQLGPFSLEEVNRKLADGTFAGTDLAWYEGAAGWAPLSGVAGIVLPPAAGVPRTPAPTPTPAQSPAPISTPAPVQPVPLRPNVPIVQSAPRPTRTLSIVSWALLGITLLVSFVPVVGCGTWVVLGVPVALTAVILGVIMLSRGGTGSGILSIVGGLVIVPVCFFASAWSTVMFGGTLERKELMKIRDNLVVIDSAKTKWIAETKATDGTPVTMASLKSQLDGKEVKSTIDETYDPMPVGQPPTATLPANKTLGTFAGGDVLTVASIETALTNSSALNWRFRKSTTPSPAPSIGSTPAVLPQPSPSVAPSETASPRPSLSPRSSATPHSLISPRQREEPEETPSTRPSPSAKFAPRKGPQMNPRQSPSEREDSGGLRQGKQKPSEEQPRESPSPSPEDDDD